MYIHTVAELRQASVLLMTQALPTHVHVGMYMYILVILNLAACIEYA